MCTWMSRFLSCLAVFVLAFVGLAYADAAFDLTGPPIDVRVQRGGKELPIGQVPNLQPGDRLWIHPDLPESQSARYLMVVAFLRGATNPPPENWFTKTDTWSKSVRQEGVMIKVPGEAQQALIFLAPETGGDFGTLRSTVRGKPGAFVRAAQDLQQASLDRARLEKYLALVREASQEDAADLKQKTNLLARSLSIKVDQSCFEKPAAQQLQCLTKDSDQLVLEDAHSQSMVATLTSETSVDLLTQLSSTPHLAGASYSPYIGAVVDVVRILSSAHTAKYQYIPALAVPHGDSLNLKLNNPPSFQDPKSVIVIGLPPIEKLQPPPLRAVEPKQIFCAQKPDLVLPADGAPLIFGTELGHDFTVRVSDSAGKKVTLTAEPNAAVGGFVVDTHPLQSATLPESATASLHGVWGFDSFDGPIYHLRSSQSATWNVVPSDASALIVGRQDTIHLHSPEAVCVQNLTAQDHGKSLQTTWKMTQPDALEVKVALKDAAPGPLQLHVTLYGGKQSDVVELQTYSEAARLDAFHIHAGDSTGTLSGTRLDEVETLDLLGIHFTPGSLSRDNQQDDLKMSASSAEAAQKLAPAPPATANVTLKDGRTLSVKASIEPPRPEVVLLGKTSASALSIDSDDNNIQLSDPNEMAQDQVLRFSLKSTTPQRFAPTEKIEVATADEAFQTDLTTAKGSLTFQDPQTVLALLNPLKDLGPSAFGPLKFRVMDAAGTAGDWQPLVTLVRVPTLSEVQCVKTPEKECKLIGQRLFLIDSISSDSQFSDAVQVPEGFFEDALAIPPPSDKILYLKLRDDPSVINTATVPVVNRPRSPVGR